MYICGINYKNKLNNNPKKTTKMKTTTTQKNDKHAMQLIAISIFFLLSFVVMAAISNPRLLM